MAKPRWRENENDWTNERGTIEQQTRWRENDWDEAQAPSYETRWRISFFFFFFAESQICVFYECSISGAYESLHFLI